MSNFFSSIVFRADPLLLFRDVFRACFGNVYENRAVALTAVTVSISEWRGVEGGVEGKTSIPPKSKNTYKFFGARRFRKRPKLLFTCYELNIERGKQILRKEIVSKPP